jgi:Methyltransferase domain
VYVRGRMADHGALIAAAGGRDPDLDVGVVRGLADCREQFEEVGKQRLRYEHACSRRGDGLDVWEQPGWCRVCDRRVAFGVDWVLARHGIVIFRERLKCPRCRFNSRLRFAATLLRGLVEQSPGRLRIYLNEQVTPFYGFARGLDADVTGSEYLGDGRRPGEVVNGIRHEDALCLSFDEASLDCLISNDVFEHVPDIERALAEAARVLAPGGRLVFSVPLQHWEPRTRQRARRAGGELVHLLEPEFHGNPLSDAGSLVFYDYGWDLLDRCREAGFEDAYALGYYSPLYGHLGDGMQFVFVAEVGR